MAASGSESSQKLEMSSFVIVSPPQGNISLVEKERPVYLNPQPHNEFYAFTRGIVDISKFQEFLRNMPASNWDDETQDGNVRLTRPSHDAWGIKKV